MKLTLIILSWVLLGFLNVYLYVVSNKKHGLSWSEKDNSFLLIMFLVAPIFTIILLFELMPPIGIFEKIYNLGNKK